MKEWGIDISRWQKGLDLSKFKYLKWVIVKAGGSDDGLYIDSEFLNFYVQAKNLNLPVGIYWYTKAISIYNLDKEIDFLSERIKGLQFELPIFLDLEEDVLYNFAPDLAVRWLNRLPELGLYPGIYSSLSWWKDTLKNVSMDDIQRWLALWGDYEDPGYPCGIWQDGHINTQGMEVDSDHKYADYSFIKDKGLNGFPKQKTFSDVDKNMASYKAIMWAAAEGYIQGYKDGTFRPKDYMTREQVQVELWRMAGRPEP